MVEPEGKTLMRGVITLRMPEDLLDRLHRACDLSGRSMTDILLEGADLASTQIEANMIPAYESAVSTSEDDRNAVAKLKLPTYQPGRNLILDPIKDDEP